MGHQTSAGTKYNGLAHSDSCSFDWLRLDMAVTSHSCDQSSCLDILNRFYTMSKMVVATCELMGEGDVNRKIGGIHRHLEDYMEKSLCCILICCLMASVKHPQIPIHDATKLRLETSHYCHISQFEGRGNFGGEGWEAFHFLLCSWTTSSLLKSPNVRVTPPFLLKRINMTLSGDS